MKSPNHSCHYKGFAYIKFAIFLFLIISVSKTFGQIYPPDINANSVDWESYVVPQSLPNFMESFIDPYTNNEVIRVSDESVFGCDCSQLRHIYAKKQPWNSNGTKIMTGGWPSKILDGNTYEVLSTTYCRSLWSNVDPDITFDSHENKLFKRNIVTQNEVTVKSFDSYTSISIGEGEGNLSSDDRYVALIATSGSQKTILVYDILNDQIIGTKSLGTANIDWVSVSQSGEFVVLSGYSDGSGPLQGIKAYDKFMNNEVHLYSGRPHGDIGYDTLGNEVFVGYQGISGYSLSYARLDNGQKQGLFPYTGTTGDRGLWGGHISTRNLNRPGWAYVSDQGHPTDINRHEATREIFAIKLDDSQTIERFAKHNSDINISNGYNHQAHAVPNRDGSKVLFASNWDNPELKNNSYPVMWIANAPQNNSGVNASAGQDQNICDGQSTTLTASGGDTYLWNTGATTQSITVTPDTTTTYSVTAFIDSESDTDDVIVNVYDIPVANAGTDEQICDGETISLTATGGSSYIWSNGATSATINVSPSNTTTYSVTVTQNGCTDIDDVLVTVNPSPIANAGNDVSIAEGETITLNASGGDSYVWSTGESTESIMVTPSSTTTYTVIALLNGCEDSDDVIVTVETSQVVASAGEDVVICEGNRITLTATGGTDYLWSTGETTQSITVNPSSTTNYTVIVSNESSSDTDDVTVSVNPIPEVNVSDDATILEGNYITLSASGANNYEWSNGATQPNIAVSPGVTTTYVVTGYVNNCYDVKDVTVSVVEQVIIDAGEDTSMCLGDEITLIAMGSGAEDFIWNTGETTQSITVSPEEDTMFTVIASNSLDSDADEIMVMVNTCEEEEIIPEEEAFGFEVYLDSRISDDILNVKISGLGDQCELNLFDISGKLIHTDIFNAENGQEIIRSINTSSISDGVYVLTIMNDDAVHSKNLVIR